jgi:ferric-dicitrate binding protein FerR (iron transport regulator)
MNRMDKSQDLVESLIRTAGRRVEPPEDAYRQVFAAAHEAFRVRTARRRESLWVLWAGAAAVLVLAVALMMQWTPPGAGRGELARIERAIGGVERATGNVWQPVGESAAPLTRGMKLRTLAGAHAGLVLAGGASLRLAPATEIMLDEPGRLYLSGGTVYLDHRGSVGTGYRIETPAGTVRDVGTQFELRVAKGALRLRVREGSVEIDRAGQTLGGAAGEQLEIDALGGVTRSSIPATDAAWQWTEATAPTPDMDGKPAAELIAWVARETGRRLRYASAAVEQRATTVILHGNIRHLPPLSALDAMLATTDLEYALDGDTMEIRARSATPAEP